MATPASADYIITDAPADTLARFRAQRLSSRFGLPPRRAALMAEFAWGQPSGVAA